MRGGSDAWLPTDLDGRPQHTLHAVYGEMLLQICSSYPGLPDARTLKISEIRFFYDGLRSDLRKSTK